MDNKNGNISGSPFTILADGGAQSCCTPSTGCCGSEPVTPMIQKVSTELSFKDVLGGWKARWGIGRMNFKVEPGLYSIGSPEMDEQAPVVVTANYKMTFDVLRKELGGQNLWLLVLDTKGINVWCAAGKGTFGTKELLNRIVKTKLQQVVKGRTLIIPQLGAPGISAHEVTKKSGFKVIYGPIEARDLPAFMASGFKATEAMRRVRFSFYDRLVLTPMEFVGTLKPSLMLFGILFLLNLLGIGSYGRPEVLGYVASVLTGCVLVPILLPWIPGRSFAWKGWLMGLLATLGLLVHYGWPGGDVVGLMKGLGYLMTFPMLSSYFALNFTGCTTYTSLSGVMKEMRLALPVMGISGVMGILLILLGSIMGV